MALWTPADLAVTPEIIFDGDATNWSGSTFATTAHLGSLGGNLVAANSTVSKGTAINGHITFGFTGANSLEIDDLVDWPAGRVTIFSVFNAASGTQALIGGGWGTGGTTVGWTIFTRDPSGGAVGAHTALAGDLIFFGSGNNAAVNHTIATTPISNGATHIMYAEAGTACQIRVDGTDESEPARSLNGAGNAFTDMEITFGNSFLNIEYHIGDVAYLLATSVDLTVDEIEKLEGWAAWKYGLQGNLPGGHPYKSAAPGDVGSNLLLGSQRLIMM